MDSELRKALVQELGLQALSEEEQNSAIERIGAVIFQNVLMRTYSTLPPETQTELEAIMADTTKPETLFAFLQTKVPDLDAMIKEEVIKFKAEATSVMEGIQS